jgi:3-methyladenine DNA glycosylase AlkD
VRWQPEDADSVLIAAIRTQLGAAADPVLAPSMQAYMKSAMPYLGVRVPTVRSLARAAEKTRPPTDVGVHLATVALLWDEAEFREERYAAAALLDTPTARRLRTPAQLPLLTHMIQTGRWWDHVDEVSHRVGDLLKLDREPMAGVLRAWAAGDDLWLRRSAIIAQLGARTATDLDLLSDVIEAAQTEPEFFLRKAIGWALRDYARTDAGWVRAFIDAHPALSGLSRREALKHL